MAEDRMLNDEILLGLIKANAGGGGGTTNYNLLENKPQIAGTELQGNKSLADFGIASAQDVKKEFIGTLAEWNALSPAQQKAFDTYQITDDYSEALMPNYSTTEQKTGQKWIDGKDIYCKVIELGALPNATTKNVAHNITNISKWIKIVGVANNTNNTTGLSIPLVYDGNNATNNTRLAVNNTNVMLETDTDRSSFNECYAILYYTKTA